MFHAEGMRDRVPDRVAVFRGTEPVELDLVEGLLELEGLRPLRLGRTQPALMGGGNSAFEQVITVGHKDRAAAEALLDTLSQRMEEAELERQALAAEPLGEQAVATPADRDVAANQEPADALPLVPVPL